jgi:hypothetical protein
MSQVRAVLLCLHFTSASCMTTPTCHDIVECTECIGSVRRRPIALGFTSMRCAAHLLQAHGLQTAVMETSDNRPAKTFADVRYCRAFQSQPARPARGPMTATPVGGTLLTRLP